MASAHIIFQQNGDGYLISTSRDDLVLGLPVTVLNQDNTGVTSWQWIMVDRPNGSAASFVSPTASTTTFTPDVVGTYLVKLVVNLTITNQKGAAIKTAKLHYRIPAATETTEFDGTRGWASAANAALRVLDDGYVPQSISTFQSVYNASNPSSFTLNLTNGGLQIHDASTSIGGSLFEVDAYGAGATYFKVDTAASTFVGQLLQTGGKVGLGTATPGAGYTNLIPDLSVHVFKAGHNMFLIDTGATSSVDAGLVFYTAAVGADAAIFLDESDGQKIKVSLGSVDSDANRNTNTKLTIQQDGSVGIGTTSPTSALHVSGTGHFTANLTLDSGFASGAQASMGGFKIVSLATPTIGTDAANKSYVDSTVGGAGNLSGTLTVTRIPYATAVNTLSDSANLVWDNTGSILKIQNTWTGNRVIGSNADDQEFKIFGGQVGGSLSGGEVRVGGGTRVDTSLSIIQFNQNGTEIARFQGDNTNGNAGSLGINTNDPRYKLDVTGTGHISSSLLVGLTPTNNPGTQLLLTNQSSPPFLGIQGHVTGAPTVGIKFFDASAGNRGQILSTVLDGSLYLDYDGYPGTGALQIRNAIGGPGAVVSIDNVGTAIFTNPIEVDGYKIDPGFTAPNMGDSLVYNGSAFIPIPIIAPLISDNSNLLLTTTSATNVISYTPTTDGDFVVFVYYRVITATTTLTIDITWTDGTGAQVFSALPISAQTVGSYSTAPLYITAKTTAPIVVTATAATANQIYVSASSMSLMTSVNTGAEPAIAEKADIFGYLLTTTGIINVLAFTPPINENYFVYIYYRVTNATTNVTIDLTFNDGGGAQVLNILPISAKSVGSYSVSPVYISAVTTAPIIVKVTAGTANNVYVSATIIMV